MNDVIIGLLSCCTKKYYIDQMETCKATWCENSNTYFFSGEKCGNKCDSKTIHLPNVSDDVYSASDKQWYGLRWMYENFPNKDYYYLAGTDTYARLDKLIPWLKNFNPDELLYIGGDDINIDVLGKSITYHSGGPGFILSNALMKTIYPLIPNWMVIWNKLDDWLRIACDVSIAFLLKEIKGVQMVTNDKFFACNWKGLAKGKRCCKERTIDKIWVCHYMEPKDMYDLKELGDLDLKEKNYENKENMDKIVKNYRTKCETVSDINEHLPVISSYVEKCETVTEFGMRSVISTWAMLYGLTRDNNYNNKRLVSVDLNYNAAIEEVKDICNSLKIDFYFVMGDDIKIEIEQTDLLFIDTWHIYGHLKRELEKHHDKVNKYIILHDTTIDGEFGETIRNGWDANQQSIDTGYTVEEIRRGLRPAVEEFILKYPNWKIEKQYTNNNGLTILSKHL